MPKRATLLRLCALALLLAFWWRRSVLRRCSRR